MFRIFSEYYNTKTVFSDTQQTSLRDTAGKMIVRAVRVFFPESDERRVLVVYVFRRAQVARPGWLPVGCRWAAGGLPVYRKARKT